MRSMCIRITFCFYYRSEYHVMPIAIGNMNLMKLLMFAGLQEEPKQCCSITKLSCRDCSSWWLRYREQIIRTMSTIWHCDFLALFWMSFCRQTEIKISWDLVSYGFMIFWPLTFWLLYWSTVRHSTAYLREGLLLGPCGIVIAFGGNGPF